MATISGTSRPGYVWDSTDNVWYPIGTGVHTHDYIPNSIADAKGDLVTASANDTPARLAVGANGETLVADSSTSTGLRWQSAYNGNAVINGAFDITQRGTSVAAPSSANTNVLDRFQLNVGASCTSTVSQQSVGDTTNLPNIRYCARVQRNSGQTGTSSMYLATSMETAMSIPYAGQTVTVSFYARAGANYSAASNALGVTLRSGTGTDQNVYGYTGGASPIDTVKTLTTTWQRFTATATVSATATELAIYFTYNPTGTAGAADYYEVTGVQLELGSVATTFKRAGGTIQGELAACQRYYWRQGGESAYQYFANGVGQTSTTNVRFIVVNPVVMRVKPTSIDFSTLQASDGNNALVVTAVVFDQAGSRASSIDCTVTSAVGQRPYILLTNASAAGYLGMNAEL